MLQCNVGDVIIPRQNRYLYGRDSMKFSAIGSALHYKYIQNVGLLT